MKRAKAVMPTRSFSASDFLASMAGVACFGLLAAGLQRLQAR
ncbi:MAG: hypothetical protein AAF533_08450 [Acidobacteriota bacterium]